MMLEQILRHIKNWFLYQVYEDVFTIMDGSISLPCLSDGQYFRIKGSVFNDGLHKYPATDLKDEIFMGEVWALAVPEILVNLANEIESWQLKNGESASGPYSSESFGGYTYTRAVDAKTGGAMTWEGVFRSQLDPWRKI